jgi:hypothetical protein
MQEIEKWEEKMKDEVLQMINDTLEENRWGKSKGGRVTYRIIFSDDYTIAQIHITKKEK